MQAGATEQEALVEAALHSSSALGNYESGEVVVPGWSGDNHPAPAPGVSTSATSASSFPVEIEGIKQYVHRQRMFASEQPEQREAVSELGERHVAFVLEQTLLAWRRAASESIAVLVDASEARLQQSAVLGKNRRLSLVHMTSPGEHDEHEKSARFVHWQIPGRTGRPVNLDELNRVKALVFVGALREAMDLSRDFIIHPNIGVTMVRSRGYQFTDRPTIPQNMLRLQRVCELVILRNRMLADGGASESEWDHMLDGDDDDDTTCFFCRRVSPGVPFPVALGTGALFRCPLCTKPLGCTSIQKIRKLKLLY